MDTYDYLRFVLSLAFVLALMGIAALGLKRYGGAGLAAGGRRRLKVHETRSIDHRHKLVLVSVDGREHLLLLGPTGQSVVEAAPPASVFPPVKETL